MQNAMRKPMNLRTTAVAVLILLSACATATGSLGHAAVLQADHRDPARAEEVDGSGGAEFSLARDALAHLETAQNARRAGNEDQARVEGQAAAEGLVSFVETYPQNGYDLVLLRMASQASLEAHEPELAAQAAERLGKDPRSNDLSRAIAARLSATAWQQAAMKDMRAGKIPPLQLLGFEARKGAQLKPQAPAAPWKSFVDAVDRYAGLAGAPGIAAALGGATDLPQLELVAGQVEFGYDNMQDARRIFLALIERFAALPEIMESAVPYYLETFRILKDDPGYDEALAKVQPIIAAEARRARDAAAASGAGEAQQKAAAAFGKLDDDLSRRLRGSDYSAAAALLRKGEVAEKAGKGNEALGHYKEAAALFEKFTADNPDSPDAPNALYNAAVAWDKAKDRKKAIAEREKLVQAYPDAKIVPQALVRLGVGLAVDGNNAAAAKAYETYLARWPDGPQHCIALQNLGVAQQNLGKKLEASERYEQFAADASCVKEDLNNAARVLYEAGKLLTEAKRIADAKKVFQDLVALQGVSSATEKAYQADARDRLARMK
jgi:tetratricopeptide (TPR) repeat protein